MASKKYIVDLDMSQQQIMNAAFQTLPTAPSSPTLAQHYVDTTLGQFRMWYGGGWVNLSQVYVHPTYTGTAQPTNVLSGAKVISQITVENGHVTGVQTRDMTPADIGASAATHAHAFGDITGLPTQTILGNNTASIGPAKALTQSDVLLLLGIAYGTITHLNSNPDQSQRTWSAEDLNAWVNDKISSYITVVDLALGTRTATTLPITNSAGTGVTLPVATTTLAGLLSAADKTKLDNIATGANNYVHPTQNPGAHPFATALTQGVKVLSQMTVTTEGHVTSIGARDLTAADLALVMINNASNDATTQTWSASKIYSELQAAINQAQTGALIFKGPYNPVTNAPDIKVIAPAGTIKTGFTYVVSVAGDFLGEAVEPGDMIIARVDNPGSTLSNWQIVNKNIPAINYATTLVDGLIRLATQAEAIAGTNNTKAITPLTLKAVLDQYTGGFYTVFGNGSNVSFDINHQLGTDRVMVQVREVSSKREIIMDWRAMSASSVILNMNIPPSTGAYEVLITKI